MAVYTDWTFEGTVTIGFWVYKGGVWSRNGTATISASSPPQSTTVKPGNANVSWSYDGSQYLGEGANKVGITVESFTGGPSANVSVFSTLAWTAAGTPGGSRSATPAGQKSIATVSP